MSSSYGSPILIGSAGDAQVLDAAPLQGERAGEYSEDWLQSLLFRYPQTLPISEIDRSFEGLIPVCRELSTPAGGIDVLYVTPQGRLAIVEAKLWRNPEARRKVVAQILDYAKELAQWTFERLDAAVKGSRRRDAAAGKGGLADIVRAVSPAFEEARFIDGVSRSLRRGDLLLLIVGDGIREGVGAITEFLETHGTLHFTFGLIEMAIYKVPGGGQLVQPRVLAQSAIVRRIVVTADAGLSVQEDTGTSDVAIESEVDPARAETRRYFTEFWTEVLSGWQLDDQSQPVPGPSRSTNLYFSMPSGSDGWVLTSPLFSLHSRWTRDMKGRAH